MNNHQAEYNEELNQENILAEFENFLERGQIIKAQELWKQTDSEMRYDLAKKMSNMMNEYNDKLV